MIVPMKHAVVLCLASGRAAALEALAKFGFLHVETHVTETPSIADASAALERVERASLCLAEAERKGDDLAKAFPGDSATGASSGDSSFAGRVCSLAADYASRTKTREALLAEIARFAPWGDFDPAKASDLAARGVKVTLFVSPIDRELPESDRAHVAVLSLDGKSAYGAIFGEVGELPPDVKTVPLPAEPLSATRAKLAECERAMREDAGAIRALASERAALASERALAEANGTRAVVEANLCERGCVAHIEGWVPAESAKALEDTAAKEGWGVALRDPEEDENPPVQLRPPRLFRPILALLGALDILPAYGETDISVPFYCFFTLFFAMLVGDAGYGLLLVALWFALRRKFRGALARKAEEKKNGAPDVLRSSLTMLIVFSCATVFWGVATATWFGMPHEWLPAWMIPPTSDWLGDQNNIMRLCFAIGLVHLATARLWNAVQLFPDSRALSHVGWAAVLFGMYKLVCSIAVAGCSFPGYAGWSLGIGVALVMLFSFKRSELKANAVSLAMTPLNVISSMGDIISYIRLFAVGLAAVKIAETFNTMAAGLGMPLALKIPVMIIILLFGHVLNLVMGALSILVHAVRLNTLEFSSAKGVSWSGRPYSPFNATSTSKDTP